MEYVATWRTAEILLGREEFQAGGAVDTHFYGPTVCIFWVLDQIELNQSFEYGLSNNLLNSHVHEVKLVFLSQLFCTVFSAHTSPVQLALDTVTRCYLRRQPSTPLHKNIYCL